MTVKDRPQIDYAPGRSRRTVRRVRFLIYSLLFIAVLAPVGWKCGPRAWQRVQVLYWQRKAMRHTAAPDLVVYETNSTEQWSCVPVGEWHEFYRLCSPPGRHGLPTLFVHELRSSRGNQRLLALEGPWERLNYDHDLDLTVTVLRPGSLFSQPTELSCSKRLLELRADRARDIRHLHVFAGQSDISDSSHFMVRFELNGKPGMLDGWLLDDDTVRLEVRGGNLNRDKMVAR
jgi:hypothetical protein